MKPPVKIDDLLEQWSKDCVYNETNPDTESSKIPILHAKYLQILSYYNLKSKKLTLDYNKLKRIKFEYYSGDLNNPEDLEHYGYEPMNKKLLKSSVPTYVDSDEELNNILMKRLVYQEIVDVCTSILKELNNRTFQIGNIVKWEQFHGGR
jgi:hypothetical protein